LGNVHAEIVNFDACEFDSRAVAALNDSAEFETLLNNFKPFLKARASRMAGGRGSRDLFDELTNDAFLAFYEAVKAYNQMKGHFFPFMRNIVHMRLIDNIRKSSVNRITTIPLETDDEDGSEERRPSQINSVSVEMFKESNRRDDLATEIECYERELKEWGISMDSLAANSPKHSRLRGVCREIIDTAASDEGIMRTMRTKHYFPIKRISRLTKIHPKTIERARIFIIGSLIIHAGDYDYLKQYVIIG